MGRTPGFDRIVRAMRLGKLCALRGLSASEALERAAEARHLRQLRTGITRREMLRRAGAAAAVGLLGMPRLGRAAPKRGIDVGIVGAGLAGLGCADALAASGVAVTLYEGRERLGGRQWSLGGTFPGAVTFPGQVVERGGELIDTLHSSMKGYAKALGLKLEDMTKEWLPGETAYYFDGERVSEEEVVDEFRDLVDRMRPDLAALSNFVDVGTHSDFDVSLDFTNLRHYLETRGAGRIAMKAIDTAYNIEYGREIEEQSCLNFLFFIHIDKRSRFQPFGVFSDERYHVIGGNEQIAQGIAASLPGPIRLGRRLLRVAQTSDGRVRLVFDKGGKIAEHTHDAVVLAIPFSTLRDVDIPPSVATDKQFAIDRLEYGTNAKLNVGMTRRIWGDFGSQGDSYSDLPHHQNTWEPNPIAAAADRAVLLDYSGGRRGERLNPNATDKEARDWLGDVDRIWPGAFDAARRTSQGKIVAHLQHWPSDPFIRGSYTCNQPGYFTTLEGIVGTPSGQVYFAGEHTDSFYEWQGFMEGALNSGARAAREVTDDAR